MWCAYAFALLAVVALPQAIQGGLLPIVQWISQIGRASDKRAVLAYNDAEATLHETEQIQAHLRARTRPSMRSWRRSSDSTRWVTTAEPCDRPPASFAQMRASRFAPRPGAGSAEALTQRVG